MVTPFGPTDSSAWRGDRYASASNSGAWPRPIRLSPSWIGCEPAFGTVGADQDEAPARHRGRRRGGRRPAMNIVRGWPTGALAPEGAAPMRVPHAPQNANPAWTMLAAVRARNLGRPGRGRAGSRRSGARGAGVDAAAGTRRRRRPGERVRRQLKRHGRRHLGRVVPGDAALGLRHGAARCGARPQLPWRPSRPRMAAERRGGSTVRAVSMGPSVPRPALGERRRGRPS